MIRILITGCAGFIGSHLAESFLKKNFFTIGIDNLSNNYSKKVYYNNIEILNKFKSFKFCHEDILNKKRILTIFRKFEPHFVIHCAGKVGIRESINNPFLYYKINVLGTLNLLELIKKINQKCKIILFSSSSIYGSQKKIPFSETMLPQPISPYGLSKYFVEILGKWYSEKFKMKIVVVRPFSIYGPRGRTDMLPFLIFKNYFTNNPIIIYGSNYNNRRDWTYIDDLIEIINKIINNFDFNFEIFNIGYGKDIGIDDFIKYFTLQLKKIKKKRLKKIRYKKNKFELSITLSDISKYKKKLNYTPKIPYTIGIKKTINFFIKNFSLYLND